MLNQCCGLGVYGSAQQRYCITQNVCHMQNALVGFYSLVLQTLISRKKKKFMRDMRDKTFKIIICTSSNECLLCLKNSCSCFRSPFGGWPYTLVYFGSIKFLVVLNLPENFKQISCFAKDGACDSSSKLRGGIPLFYCNFILKSNWPLATFHRVPCSRLYWAVGEWAEEWQGGISLMTPECHRCSCPLCICPFP